MGGSDPLSIGFLARACMPAGVSSALSFNKARAEDQALLWGGGEGKKEQRMVNLPACVSVLLPLSLFICLCISLLLNIFCFYVSLCPLPTLKDTFLILSLSF